MGLIHPQGERKTDGRWWLPQFKEPAARAAAIGSVAGQIWRDAESLRTGYARWSALYQNDPFVTNAAGHSPVQARRRAVTSARTSPLSLNAVKAVGDTYVALVTRDRPKVSAVTSGGDWEAQENAKNIETFIEGVLYENDAYRLATQLNYDVIKCGTGIAKVCDERPRRTRISIERVEPMDVLCHPDDGRNGKPQCLYQTTRYERAVLQELWPEHAADLENGGSDFRGQTTDANFSASGDFVLVVEAWRLPQAEGSPGRHCIVCGDATLLDEEWTRDDFPLVFLYRQQPAQGIWGMSLAQELSGLQLAVNKLLRDIQRAQALVVGHYLIDNATEVNTGSISDRIGGFIRYRGTRPVYEAPPPVSQQNIEYLDKLWGRCFETIGISQQAAQSQKPAGIESGKAMLVYADIQSQRFKPSYEEYQHFFLRLGRSVLETARGMDEDFYVHAAGKKVMTSVNRAGAMGLAKDEFTLKLYATNALVDDPAARLQQVQDMMTAGLIDAKAGKRLLELPDLREFEEMEDASYNLVMRIISEIKKGGKYVGPEPFMDLTEGVWLMQHAYLLGKLDGVPEDRLELMSTWIAQAQFALQANAPPPAPPALPGGPGAPPGATPPVPPGGPLGPAQPQPTPIATI